MGGGDSIFTEPLPKTSSPSPTSKNTIISTCLSCLKIGVPCKVCVTEKLLPKSNWRLLGGQKEAGEASLYYVLPTSQKHSCWKPSCLRDVCVIRKGLRPHLGTRKMTDRRQPRKLTPPISSPRLGCPQGRAVFLGSPTLLPTSQGPLPHQGLGLVSNYLCILR